jgi:CIC family chloride channel protein
MDDTVQTALTKITDKGVSQLPVLRSEGSRTLVGTLTESAIASAYNSAAVRDEMSDS